MFSLLKKNKKINNMNIKNNKQEIDLSIIENELKNFHFKWIKGELKGHISIFKNVFKDPKNNIIWVNFEDGNRINYSLLEEYTIKIEKNNISSSSKYLNTNNNNDNDNNNNNNNNDNDNIIQPIKNIKIEENKIDFKNDVKESPIILLLKKQKPNWVDVNINLRINLPTKELYNILTSSFEGAEEEIIKFVINDLDIEIIKESLKISIKRIYNHERN